ncbi:MAG: lipopolysaccharide biosynthesis protein [Rhodothermales bacterium]|nr:lipopolysaccharide biosynthesis protein [Rhodothermales bacterium]
MSFSLRIRTLASETAVYGISTIVGRIINFLLVPLYVAFFAPGEYGVVVTMYTTITIINHLFQHGMESSYLKFASGKEGRARISEVFSTATWSLFVVSIGLSVLVLFLRSLVSGIIGIDAEWAYLFYYAIGFQTLDALALLPFSELRLQNKASRFALLKMVNIGLNVGLNVVLIIGLGWGIEAVFLSNLIAAGATFLMVLPTYFQLFRFRIQPGLWRELVWFGLPFVPSGLSYALVDRVNVIFVGRMDATQIRVLYEKTFDLSALIANSATTNAEYGQHMAGIFGAVWKLGVFMMLIAQMFRFAWQPFFLQHADDPDARPLFARIFSLFTAFSLLVVLGITFLIDDFVALPIAGGRPLIPEMYWPALYLVPIALLAYLFQGWYYHFTAGAYIERKTRYFVYCTFAGGALTLIANALLVPTYGMIAAAWATTAAYATMAIMLYVFVQRFFPVPYDWRGVALMVGWAGGLYGVWRALPIVQHWWAELVLLGIYLVGILTLRIVTVQSFRQFMPPARRT